MPAQTLVLAQTSSPHLYSRPSGTSGTTRIPRPSRPPGPPGPGGDGVTESSAYAANTSGSTIAVVEAGTLVPLPDAQNLSDDVTIDATDTIFTINEAGRYYISYTVNPTAAVLVGARLVINGMPNEASTVLPLVATTSLSGEVLVTVPAGTTVSLELFGLIAVVLLPIDAAGATLSILRVE